MNVGAVEGHDVSENLSERSKARVTTGDPAEQFSEQDSGDLVGPGDVDGSAVRSFRHVVSVFHQLHLDILGFQVVDEVRDVRV